jgi:hypothetical protein
MLSDISRPNAFSRRASSITFSIAMSAPPSGNASYAFGHIEQLLTIARRSGENSASRRNRDTVRTTRVRLQLDRGEMIQRGQRLCLALEPRQALEISGERVGKDLDCDLATKRRVRRSVHVPHPAFAD